MCIRDSLQVAEAGQSNAALHAVAHFARIVLEALERVDFALEYLLAAPHHLDLGIAANDAVLHTASGNGAHLRNLEHVDDFRLANVVLLEGRVEKAQHSLSLIHI